MKKYISLLLFLFPYVFIQAQEKQVFSETFIDNHNNWPLIDKKGLKTSISPEKYYDINNQSKDDYTSLIDVPLDSLADNHIVMAFKDLRWSDKNFAKLTGGCRFVIGARDEKSGYVIGISKDLIGIYAREKHPNSSQFDYQDIQIKYGTEDYLDMRIENNRWKFYNKSGEEVANTPARPLDGNKIGVTVYQPARYALTNVMVAEKEKNIIKTDFPLALFMVAYRNLLCSASHLFIDDKGAQYGAAYDSMWYCKTNVPGFASNTLLIMKKNDIELLTNRRFKTKDEAFAYYQEALGAIKLTKDTCIELSNNTAQLLRMDNYKEHFIQFDNWRSGFRDDHAQKVEGNVLLGISKRYNDSDYLLEFHIILYLSGKVFSN